MNLTSFGPFDDLTIARPLLCLGLCPTGQRGIELSFKSLSESKMAGLGVRIGRKSGVGELVEGVPCSIHPYDAILGMGSYTWHRRGASIC